MKRVGEVATTWPTLGFTAVLAFFLVWWVLSLAVSGIDGADIDADGDGASDGLFGRIGHFVGIGSVPLSFGLTILALGSWSISLLAELAVGERLDGPGGLAFAVAVSVASVWIGLQLTRRVVKRFAPVFDFHSGPSRRDAHGATVKVRTQFVDDRFGEAEVLDGPRVHSIVRVRATLGQFKRGDVAMILDYNEVSDTYALIPIDSSLRPDGS